MKTPGTITGNGRTYLLDQALLGEDHVCIDITAEQATRIPVEMQHTLAEFVAGELGRDGVRVRFPVPHQPPADETVTIDSSGTTWSSQAYNLRVEPGGRTRLGLLDSIAWCFGGESRGSLLCAAADIRRDARAMRDEGHSSAYVALVRSIRIAATLGPVLLDAGRRAGHRIGTTLKAWLWFS